ncbi:hypothetical protein MASR1M74_01330 [Lentimicrobium sp.]
MAPISTETEKLFIKTYNESAALKDLQQFFFNFWYSRNPVQTEQAWKKYNAEVIRLNFIHAVKRLRNRYGKSLP